MTRYRVRAHFAFRISPKFVLTHRDVPSGGFLQPSEAFKKCAFTGPRVSNLQHIVSHAGTASRSMIYEGHEDLNNKSTTRTDRRNRKAMTHCHDQPLRHLRLKTHEEDAMPGCRSVPPSPQTQKYILNLCSTYILAYTPQQRCVQQ